jgi:hypothetical protein
VGRVTITGWLLRHTFSVRQLQRDREEIIRMLLCMQAGFRTDERGGGSVGAAIVREDGQLWTNDMSDVEKLISVGMALGLVEFCAPRDRWGSLPGGLPYVRVMISRFGATVN